MTHWLSLLPFKPGSHWLKSKLMQLFHNSHMSIVQCLLTQDEKQSCLFQFLNFCGAVWSKAIRTEAILKRLGSSPLLSSTNRKEMVCPILQKQNHSFRSSRCFSSLQKRFGKNTFFCRRFIKAENQILQIFASFWPLKLYIARKLAKLKSFMV